MEEHGGRRTSIGKTVLNPNDVLISPNNNTLVFKLPDSGGFLTTVETFSFPVTSWVSTMSPQAGAGFYTSLWGPLPYVFGATPPEIYVVQRVNKSIPWK